MLTTLNDFIVRAPRMDELAAITEMIVAVDIAETGEPDYSEEELLQDWQREHFNLERDARVVLTPEGQIIGYTDVCYFRGGMLLNPNTNVHPDYAGRGIVQDLYRLSEQRAYQYAQEVRASGSAKIPTTIWTICVIDELRPFFAQEGYEVVRREVEMEIKMEQPPQLSAPPAGITLRLFQPGQDEHTIHHIISNAFAELADHDLQEFADWEEGALKRPDFDPGLVFIAQAGIEAVGVTMAYDYGSGGWIRQVAVARPWRRRGIAQFLVTAALSELYRRGKRHCGLTVDPLNVTGAPRVYERVGMHVRRRYDTLEKPL